MLMLCSDLVEDVGSFRCQGVVICMHKARNKVGAEVQREEIIGTNTYHNTFLQLLVKKSNKLFE